MPGITGQVTSLLHKIRGKPRETKASGTGVNRFHRIFIEPCFNICNLRCPYCPVGQGVQLRDMSKGMMSLDTFRLIMDNSFRQFRGEMALYNWGEPFLNPALPKMVEYAKKHSPARLILNSNLSLSMDDRIVEMLEHLEEDTIVISCDGFSQEICEIYRVNVNFDLVMHNIELIHGRKNPKTKLIWQYLRFPWNSAEEKAAERYCTDRNIKFILGTGGMTSAYPVLPTPRSGNKEKHRCRFFLNALSINYDGEVYPCCAYYGPPKYSLGNARNHGLGEIFSRGNGKKTLAYLAYASDGDDGLFCKHCVERNTVELESWSRPRR